MSLKHSRHGCNSGCGGDSHTTRTCRGPPGPSGTPGTPGIPGIPGVPGTGGGSAAGGFQGYASGTTVTLTPAIAGVPRNTALIASGTSTILTESALGTLDLTSVPLNVAFTAAQALPVSALAATFTTTAPVTLAGTVTLEASIYVNTPGNANQLFTRLASTVVTLAPTLPAAVIPTGTILAGIAVFNPTVVIPGGSRYVFALSATGSTTGLAPVTGFASGGITAGEL